MWARALSITALKIQPRSLLSGSAIAIIQFPFKFDAAKPGDDGGRVSGQQEPLFVTPPTGRSGKVVFSRHDPTGYCGLKSASDFGGCGKIEDFSDATG